MDTEDGFWLIHLKVILAYRNTIEKFLINVQEIEHKEICSNAPFFLQENGEYSILISLL